MISTRAWFFLAVALAGCANLPDIAPGTCGNGVIEPPEDCDTFAPGPNAVCLPPGAVGECHLDCRRTTDGSRPSCPDGWGCDPQGICRAPTGNFQTSPQFKVGGTWSLMAGDFDGDGREDVVSLEAPDLRGGTKIRFHYFDERGALVETRPFPKAVAAPIISDLSADARSDLVFSSDGFGVGVLLGQVDRTLVPETAGSYHFPDTSVRMISIYDDTIEQSSPVLGLATIGGVPGLYGPNTTGQLLRRGTLPGRIETLVGDPAGGNIIEDPVASPCRELVVAVRDASSVSSDGHLHPQRRDGADPVAYRHRYVDRAPGSTGPHRRRAPGRRHER